VRRLLLLSQFTKLSKFTLVETGNGIDASKDTCMRIAKARFAKDLATKCK